MTRASLASFLYGVEASKHPHWRHVMFPIAKLLFSHDTLKRPLTIIIWNHETCHLAAFYFMKNYFSDISRKCISPNMLFLLISEKIFFHKIKFDRMTSFMDFMFSAIEKHKHNHMYFDYLHFIYYFHTLHTCILHFGL